MGKEETSKVSIGIKILLSDLISQINQENFELISDILYNGFIEDDNDNYNEVPENWLEYKEHLETKFKQYGSYNKSRFISQISYTIKNGSLYDKYLLVPNKELLSTTRWGYDREGINANSTPINFDLSINTDQYKDIQNYNIVLIMKQLN